MMASGPAESARAISASERLDSSELGLLELLGVLWNGRWIILFCTFFTLFLGVYYTFSVAVPKYTAITSLVVEAANRNIVDFDSVIAGSSTEEAAINTELEVIRSRSLIAKLVEELDLVSDPEFNFSLRERSWLSLSTVIGAIRSLQPGYSEPEEPSDEEILNSVIDSVQSALNASSKRNTYLIYIRATTTSKEKSAKLLNALAKLYIEEQIQTKFAATEFAVSWLSVRVTELEVELKDKEAQIKDLRAETDLVSVEGLEVLNFRAKDMRDRLTATQAEEVQLRATVEQLEDFASRQDIQDIDVIVAVFDDPELTRLADAVRAEENAAQVAFFTRLDEALEQASEQLSRTESRRKIIESSYEKIEQQIDEQNADLLNITQLVRDLEATRILHETFLTRLKETSIQIGLQQSDSRVLSMAIPGSLVSPRFSLNVAIAIILGAMLGGAVTLLRHLRNDGIHSGEQLEQFTGYSVLAQVPKMPFKGRKKLINFLKNNSTSATAEAVRNLRTSLIMSDLNNPPKVIASTSAIPGEGKTTISIALAGNFASLGKRVLLVEGDIRRVTLGQYFTGDAPGNLITVMDGSHSLAEAVIHEEDLNIDVLVGQRTSTNAADHFASQSFKDFIEIAKASYDVVIIDTPPVLVVPDSKIIGQLMDTIVFTVRWNSTGRRQVLDGLREFRTVGLRVDGLVLSQIDTKRMQRYGYVYGGKYGAYGSYGSDYYDI